MSDENASAMLEVNGEQVSLADIAGLSMDDVAEVRGFTFPKGLFTWQVVESGLTVRDAKGVPTAVIAHKLECVDCDVIEEGKDPADFIGKNFYETFWLKDMEDDLGKNKAFMVDTGFTGSGLLQDLLVEFAGTEFKAKITNKPDANDKSIIYANLDRRSVTPVGGAEGAEEVAG